MILAQCSAWLFEVSWLSGVFCRLAPEGLLRCDHNSFLPLDCETVVTVGRVPVVKEVSGEDRSGGLKRKSPS